MIINMSVEKCKSIPQRYMTVGEIAKKMGVTVRTMQYYDKNGLLSPSAESEGGRRLYTDKDMIKLSQILSLKHLGFSLNDIKNRLIPLDDPADIVCILQEQATTITEKIKNLSKSLRDIEALKTEVQQIQQVDFKKYADIIVNLQMENEFYWLIKYFDEATLDYIRSRFDKDSGSAMMETVNRLQNEAIQLKKNGILPKSEQGQRFAKEYWDMIVEFTNGDMSMLPKLIEMGQVDSTNIKWKQNQEFANAFIGSALDVYFAKLKYNPFENDITT